MRREKTFLPLAGMQNHGGSHCALLFGCVTTRRGYIQSLTLGPGGKRAHISVTRGYITQGEEMPLECSVATNNSDHVSSSQMLIGRLTRLDHENGRPMFRHII
jgi:hypothetical protein